MTRPVRRDAVRLDLPRCRLGESPRWTGSDWWWVDAEAGNVWRSEQLQRGVSAPAMALGERVSLVHPAVDGGVVIARSTSIQRAVAGPDGWEPTATWADLGLPEGTLLNDGVADPVGRLWIGSVGPHREPDEGSLIRIDPDGTATEVMAGFALSNGMVWDWHEHALLHVDSLARTVWRHRIDLEAGTMIDSSPLLHIDDDGLPDGIALDVSGCLWVAVYGRGEVRRFNREGAVVEVVHVPTSQTTSVALGGADGRELLITTAREGFDDARSAAEPDAGRLYATRVSAPAAPVAQARPSLRFVGEKQAGFDY